MSDLNNPPPSLPTGQMSQSDGEDAFHPKWAETILYDAGTARNSDADGTHDSSSDRPTLTQSTKTLDLQSVDRTLVPVSQQTHVSALQENTAGSIGTRIVARPAGQVNDSLASADYNVVGELGRGGMGAVHLARQTALRRMVAIKTIREDKQSIGNHLSFLDEAWVTGALDHPNIVPIYDAAYDQNGTPFYTMPRIHGKVWSEVMSELTLEDNIRIVIRVGDALAYAHDMGVLHRDLKPSNIMLGEYGEVFVLDWGLAVGLTPDSSAQELTDDRATAGTPCYLPPETAQGRRELVGVPSDIYLLGAILCQVVTGHPPHYAATVRESLQLAAQGNIPALDCDEVLRGIITCCMAFDTNERYQKVKDFQEALGNWDAHHRSLQLCEQAKAIIDDIARDSSADIYAPYTGAIANYELAVAEWPENDLACRGLELTRLAYAQRAFDGGDLSLAEAQLTTVTSGDEDVQKAAHTLSSEILRSSRLRGRRQLQFRIMLASVVVLLIGVITSLSLGYVFVDQARGELAVLNEDLDREKIRLEDALNREEVANKSLDNANSLLQVENLATRMELVRRNQEGPISAANALMSIDPLGKHARSWPWRRLVHLFSSDIQRLGGRGDQNILAAKASPDRTKIAGIRLDGQLWIMPFSDPASSVKVGDLPFAPFLMKWSPDGAYLLVAGLEGDGAIIRSNGEIVEYFRPSPGKSFGGFFRKGTVFIAHEGRILNIDLAHDGAIHVLAEIDVKWMRLVSSLEYIVAVDMNGRLWTVDSSAGKLYPTNVTILEQPLSPYLGFDLYESLPHYPDPLVAIVDKGETLLALGDDYVVQRIDLRTGENLSLFDAQILNVLKDQAGLIELIALSNEGTFSLRFMSIDNGGMAWKISRHGSIIWSQVIGNTLLMDSGHNLGFLVGLTRDRRYLSLLNRENMGRLHQAELQVRENRYLMPLPNKMGFLLSDKFGRSEHFSYFFDQGGSPELRSEKRLSLTENVGIFDLELIPRYGSDDDYGSLFVSAKDGYVSKWSLRRFLDVHSIVQNYSTVVSRNSQIGSLHGPYVITGHDGNQRLLKLHSPGQIQGELPFLSAAKDLRRVVPAPNHNWIAISDRLGNAFVYEPNEDNEGFQLKTSRDNSTVTGMAFNKVGRVAFAYIPETGVGMNAMLPNNELAEALPRRSLLGETTIEVWDVVTGERIRQFNVPGYLWDLAWDPLDGSLIAVDVRGNIMKIDAKSEKVIAESSTGIQSLHAIAMFPEKRRLVVAGSGSQSEVYSFNLNVIKRSPVSAGRTFRLAFDPTGDLVAELAAGGLLRVWSVSAGIELHRENLPLSYFEKEKGIYQPFLMWDHTSDQLFVLKRGHHTRRINAFNEGHERGLPSLNNDIQAIRRLLPLSSAFKRPEVIVSAVERFIGEYPDELRHVLPLFVSEVIPSPSRQQRLDLLARYPVSTGSLGDKKEYAVTLAHALVGDFAKVGRIVRGLRSEDYQRAQMLLAEAAPHLENASLDPDPIWIKWPEKRRIAIEGIWDELMRVNQGVLLDE